MLPARVGDLAGGAGVDQHQLGAGVHHQRGERYRQYARRQECRGERLIHLRAAGIAHELVVDRQIPDAVVKCGELIAAEIVPINSGALRFGRRHRRTGRQRQRRCAGG